MDQFGRSWLQLYSPASHTVALSLAGGGWLAQIYHLETRVANYTTRNCRVLKISVRKTPREVKFMGGNGMASWQ